MKSMNQQERLDYYTAKNNLVDEELRRRMKVRIPRPFYWVPGQVVFWPKGQEYECLLLLPGVGDEEFMKLSVMGDTAEIAIINLEVAILDMYAKITSMSSESRGSLLGKWLHILDNLVVRDKIDWATGDRIEWDRKHTSVDISV